MRISPAPAIANDQSKPMRSEAQPRSTEPVAAETLAIM